MANTDRVDVLNDFLFNLMVDHQADLGFLDIWYGDQDKIPRTPALAVEAGPKSRELNGAPRRMLVTFESYFMIYHDQIQDTQENARKAQQRGEAVEAVLHADAQMLTDPEDGNSGLVIHSYVSANEPGAVLRNNGSLMSVTRLTFRAQSQVMLPYSAM